MTLTQSLRARRLALGMTQSQLAERSGLDQSQISEMENSRKSPRLLTVERWARGLGLVLTLTEDPTSADAPDSGQPVSAVDRPQPTSS